MDLVAAFIKRLATVCSCGVCFGEGNLKRKRSGQLHCCLAFGFL